MASPEIEGHWAAVDEHLARLFVGFDAPLTQALEASDAAGLPAISVTPLQGKLLMVLALACRARRIPEISTLGGYSTIWLARAHRRRPRRDDRERTLAFR